MILHILLYITLYIVFCVYEFIKMVDWGNHRVSGDYLRTVGNGEESDAGQLSYPAGSLASSVPGGDHFLYVTDSASVQSQHWYSHTMHW